MYEDIEDVASDIDHVCHIDCDLIIREDGGRSHIMYSASPTTAAGRYQYDRNREIYTMGKGARAAMRATGQSDTRNNREWNYARKLFRAARIGISDSPEKAARLDADYRDTANLTFGPDRRPYVRRRVREKTSILGAARALGVISRPPYLAGSEHDPNL